MPTYNASQIHQDVLSLEGFNVDLSQWPKDTQFKCLYSQLFDQALPVGTSGYELQERLQIFYETQRVLPGTEQDVAKRTIEGHALWNEGHFESTVTDPKAK